VKPGDASKMRCEACMREYDAETVHCPHDGTLLTPSVHEHIVGTIFADRYELVEIIGEGGMGKVYKAMHKFMKRFVAIKVVHMHLVSSAATMTRFQQEAEAVSRLNHINIVTVHDFGLVPKPYLVMDYLDGDSLAEVLSDNGSLELARCLPIFAQVCAGLAHAHEHGVIHRDLKPSNIMVIDSGGQKDLVKIVDFGIAKLMLREMDESKHLTVTGEVFGSPLYMSPEQCRGRAMDARSDIYSLGCIMYRTLTGHQPILGSMLMECLYNHVNIAPRGFDDICPELKIPLAVEAIVMKCVEKEPENRFQSMQELKNAIEMIDLNELQDGIAITPIVAQPAAVPGQQNIAKSIPPLSPSGDDLQASGAREVQRAASALESSRAASAAESERAATAVEQGLAASAAEASRAASAAEAVLAAAAAESARAASAAEVGRAASAAEVGRAASAAEAGRAASVAETGRAASAHEAGLVAYAAEAGRVAAKAESERAIAATAPGFEPSANENCLAASAAEAGRAAFAAESGRAAAAAESARAASVVEAGLAASATEAAFVASALEAGLAAYAAESGRAASAAEAGRAASAAESGRAASAAESGRAASAAEAGRAASAAEADRAASVAEAGRIASAAEEERKESNSPNE